MTKLSLNPIVDDIQRLTYDLARYYALCDRVCAERLGVTASQGYILLAIPEADSITMNDLSEAMRLANSTMTRMVDQLVLKGAVARESDASDRRVVRVRLTDQGHDIAIRMRRALQEVFSLVLQDIPEDRRQQIVDSLTTLNRAIIKALKTCCAEEEAG